MFSTLPYPYYVVFRMLKGGLWAVARAEAQSPARQVVRCIIFLLTIKRVKLNLPHAPHLLIWPLRDRWPHTLRPRAVGCGPVLRPKPGPGRPTTSLRALARTVKARMTGDYRLLDGASK